MTMFDQLIDEAKAEGNKDKVAALTLMKEGAEARLGERPRRPRGQARVATSALPSWLVIAGWTAQAAFNIGVAIYLVLGT